MYVPLINFAKLRIIIDHDFLRLHGSLKRLLVTHTMFDINTGQRKLCTFSSVMYLTFCCKNPPLIKLAVEEMGFLISDYVEHLHLPR